MKKMNECKCCGNIELSKVLDLGFQPLANNLIDKDEQYEKHELAINLCDQCFHCQLTVAIDKEKLFSNYLYVSGTSDTLNKEFKKQAQFLCDYTQKDKINVLDIASNDGTFLKYFKKLGCATTGIDPATNLCDIANSNGINTINGFFGENDEVLKNSFDIITAFNVFAHVENPITFMADVYKILNNDGVCAIQTSQKDMFYHAQFDTIYHEHHHFYSVKSFNEICKRNSLYIYDVQNPEIHGGSYLFLIGKDKSRDQSEKFIDIEQSNGRYDIKLYQKFFRSIKMNKDKSLRELDSIKKDGYKLVGFGAAAKGIVVLNYYGIELDYIIDENTLKVDKVVPNVNSKIINIQQANNTFDENEKLCFIVLAWNFFDEISDKINESFKHDKLVISLMKF
jgi:2-polyprenyl-3-methyl-5-hydroxy-6-metoxy-1,4-benzoquinol methylase